MKRSILFLLILICSFQIFAQQTGQLSGNLQLNSYFFMKDSTIGASGTPLYENFLSSAESWFNINYSLMGFTAGLRADFFHNSNLFNPLSSYSDQGIGNWFISKDVKNLKITVGNFYDQFGSGIVFRSYEDRGLGIDYSVMGLKLDYKINDNWKVKGFTGRQKNLFLTYKPIMKGLNLEGDVPIGKNLRLIPGIAYLNRTIDQENMNSIVSNINTYQLEQRFCPMYNVYVISAYNTLNFKNVSWYAEYAYKTHEAMYTPLSIMEDKGGNVIYTSLSYSRKGFGITGQYKRTENFVLRTSPNESLLNGVLDYLPSLTKQNTMRLLSRYNAPSQYLGELAYQGDVVFTPVKGYTISLNYSNVNDLSNKNLYQEIYADLEISKFKKIKPHVGLQTVTYNQEVYQNEPGVPIVKTLTPFIETTYKINKKKSLRAELQYLSSEQDYGSWAFALLEFNIAPKFSFSVSDMYNLKPNPEKNPEKKHYYNFFFGFTQNASRFSISYVKQVEGYNCTGGVCRYEPAFSGVKLGINSTF